MPIVPIVFIVLSLISLTLVVIFGNRAGNEKDKIRCTEFGQDAFPGKDPKKCYKCPPGYKKSDEFDPFGNPTCTKINQKPMDLLRKEVIPATRVGGGYSAIKRLGRNINRAQAQASYTKPVKDFVRVDKNNICRRRWTKYGWVGYDPVTNSCRGCPKGYVHNTKISMSDTDSPQFCVTESNILGLGGGDFAHVSDPLPFPEDFPCRSGWTQDTSGFEDDTLLCYRCPEGYKRNPEEDIDSSKACMKNCPEGSFPDPKTGLCYKCSEGFERTTAPTSSDEACKRECPEGSFEGSLDNPETRGYCYRCPEGYERTDNPITGEQACWAKCPEGSFRLNGDCYQCSDGYTKNKLALNANDACYKSCGENIFSDKETRGCYKCPEGFTKSNNISPLNSEACIQKLDRSAKLVAFRTKSGKVIDAEEMAKAIGDL